MFCLTFLTLLFPSNDVIGATRYWVGKASVNWNNTGNWSTSSGGAGGATVPTVSDDVIFDENGLIDCTINTAAVCNSITVNAGYTKTITQNAALTIGKYRGGGTSVWSGGTFAGGTAAITDYGAMTISGTNFTSTAGTLALGGDFSFTSGTFLHNNGTVSLDHTLNFGWTVITLSNSAALTFNHVNTIPYYNTIASSNSFTVNGNLTLSGTGASLDFNIASGYSITVNGTLTTTGTSYVHVNTGTIIAKGDITLTNSSTNTGGTGTISIAGTGSQTLTGSGVMAQGSLPNVVINKASGTLNLASYITSVGPSWTYTAGTINAGTSTVCFYNTSTPFTVSGTHTLNNAYFYGNYSTFTFGVAGAAQTLTVTNALTFDSNTSAFSLTIPNTCAITSTGTLTLNGSGPNNFASGTLNIQGNLVNNNTNVNCMGTAGTTGMIVNGSGNQSITGTASADQGAFSTFSINKPSGTLSFSGYLTFYNGFTWTAGTVNPGNATCVFFNNGQGASQIITAPAASMSFNHIRFEQPDYLWTQLATDISVLGNLTIAATGGLKTNNHNISIGGNFVNLNTTAGSNFAYNGGTSTVTLNGSAQQTITSNNPTGSANLLVFYNVVVNNSAARATNDDVVLNDVMTVSNGITFTNGRMLTTSSSYLHLKDGATANTGTATSYVNGPMQFDMALNGARTLNFPIGDGSNLRYAILNLKHNSATSYTYTAQVIHASAAALGYTLPGTIASVSAVRYTTIARSITGGAASNNNLSGNQTITMYYGSDDLVTDYTTLTIAKTTGSGPPWVNIGGTATANTTGTVTSTSTPTAFTTFSSFALATRSVALPIHLLYFTTTTKDDKVLLNWKTETELNSDYFLVERSATGKEWEEIARVKAAGMSTTPVTYSAEDDLPLAGLSYYRLREVDMDGSADVYYAAAHAHIEGIRLYPNPVVDKLIIEAENVTDTALSIYNQEGIEVTARCEIDYLNSSTAMLDVSRFSQQVLLIRIKGQWIKVWKD